MKPISYEECRMLWESDKALEYNHHDKSDELAEEISGHIIKVMDLGGKDTLLSIGCGRGSVDSYIAPYVGKLYGMDFSKQSVRAASKAVPGATFFRHSFLDDYIGLFADKGINKIYSYSVMQYCKPADVRLFLENQTAICADGRDYLIAHMDVPDFAKAMLFYNRKGIQVEPENLLNYREVLFDDGSCWHDMDEIKRIAEDLGMDCDIKPAHYWDYRSDIILRYRARRGKQ